MVFDSTVKAQPYTCRPGDEPENQVWPGIVAAFVRVVLVALVLFSLVVAAVTSRASEVTFTNTNDFAIYFTWKETLQPNIIIPVPALGSVTWHLPNTVGGEITIQYHRVDNGNDLSGNHYVGTWPNSDVRGNVTAWAGWQVARSLSAYTGDTETGAITGAEALEVFLKGFFLMIGFEFFGLMLRLWRMPRGDDI